MYKDERKLNVAVIGAGISGLGAAWLLSKKHNVTVFEADNHFGGHANTVTAITPDGDIPVDTGFIVCNDRNYPNFLALMNEIGIAPCPTEMSFGVSMDRGGFEYAGSPKLTSLVAQPLNLVRPRFWKMVRSILRFYEETNKIDPKKAEEITLRDFLNEKNYDDGFMRDHILPMAAAVWSTPSNKVGDFPLTSFLRFCQNHGLLQVKDRPQWFTIPGGSKNYVKALMNETNAIYYNNAPITNIKRVNDGVSVKAHGKEEVIFDRILIATHANTALKMINDVDPLEKAILGSFKYAKNRAVLHSDKQFMPKRKRAWSSWNYMQNDSDDDRKLSVTYWMNMLQPLDTETNLFVTLNPEEEQRAARNGMTEEQLELVDLLKKEKLTKQEKKEVKLAAEELLAVLFDVKNKILIQEWHKEKSAQSKVRGAINRILGKHLPDSYGRQIFVEKLDVVFQHFYELAVLGRGFAA